ncbi:MAG: lasso peptide biosynthesis B2 protein [Chloroflexota bacterium]|nr:lasso peptide biosynthesis B2 protein [Chloroflexota bacterium]
MNRLGRRVVRFFTDNRYDGESRWVFILSLLLLPSIAVGLHRVGLKRMRATLEARTPQPTAAATSDSTARARRLARMVNAAARLSPYKANCLKRALVLWWLLRRRGIASDIRIGVRKGAATLEAHAWVEIGGVVINDAPSFVGTFTPFAGDIMAAYRFVK